VQALSVLLGILGSLALGTPAAAAPPVPPTPGVPAVTGVVVQATQLAPSLPPLIVGRECTGQLVCLYDDAGAQLATFFGRTDYFQQVEPFTRAAVYVRNNAVGRAAYFRHTSGRVSCAEPGLTARFPARDPVLGVMLGNDARCTFDFR
jgi:hypothetical protein